MTVRQVLAGLLATAIATADASQAPSSSFTGVVVDAQDGRPVANALLSLTGIDGPPFRIQDDGRRPIRVRREQGGAVTLCMSMRRRTCRCGMAPRNPASQPRRYVAPGAKLTQTIALIRGGAIAGTVTTEAGDPFVNGSIALWRRGYSPQTGERTIVPIWTSGGTTDDRGHYRLFNVPPGRLLRRDDRRAAAERGSTGDAAGRPRGSCDDAHGRSSGASDVYRADGRGDRACQHDADVLSRRDSPVGCGTGLGHRGPGDLVDRFRRADGAVGKDHGHGHGWNRRWRARPGAPCRFARSE